jgi:hypothetical protein
MRRETWAGFTEFIPFNDLPHGTYHFQWRHAVSQTTLGPWKTMTHVTVDGEADRKPPELIGRAKISTRPIWGTIFINPCMAEQGWNLETVLRFPPAIDNGSEKDLFYALLRKETGQSTPHLIHSFNPQGADAFVRYKFEEDSDCWAKIWEYYLCVRDPSGNSSCNSHAIIATTPSQPSSKVAAMVTSRSILAFFALRIILAIVILVFAFGLWAALRHQRRFKKADPAEARETNDE